MLLGLTLFSSQRTREIFVQALQPDYEVLDVDVHTKSMLMQKANHRYLVRCAEDCLQFSVGKRYRLRAIVNGLEFSGSDRTIVLPILQEDVTFAAEGGKG